MERFSEVLDELAALGPRGLARFEASIDPQWIEAALAHTGKASIRRRKLPADVVMWLVVGMALFRDRSIVNVVEHLNLVAPGVESLAPSAIPAARTRLGAEPMEWLFRKVAEAWADAPQLDRHEGLDLYGIDGSHLRAQDSDAHFEHFGKPGGRGGKADAGYPQTRIAVLMNLRSRMLADAAFGPFATSELALAKLLRPSIPGNSLTIFDRGFYDYASLADLVEGGANRHVLIRLRNTLTFTGLKLLPDGSALVEARPCRGARRRHGPLPPCIVGRVIAYQHGGGPPSRLFVTLTDWEKHPAEQLVELYHERWELEVGYDELKTHMLERTECLRSLSPQGVTQELWGLLLVYNLVRREMLVVAEQHGLPPTRVSFRTAILVVRDFWLITAWGAPGRVPKQLADLRMTLGTLIIPPRRDRRGGPRHVKIKMSNYPRNRGKRAAPD